MSVFGNLRGIPYRKEFLGFGDSAIYNTAAKIKDIIRISAGNPYIRRWAEKIVEGLPPNDKVGELTAIHAFVRDNMRYVKDPHGLEYLQTPPVLLNLIEKGEIPQGDCDDKTMLVLSLMKSIGYPVAIKVTGYNNDGKFAHIYGLANVGSSWIPVECVKPDRPLGWEAPYPTRVWESEVR